MDEEEEEEGWDGNVRQLKIIVLWIRGLLLASSRQQVGGGQARGRKVILAIMIS